MAFLSPLWLIGLAPWTAVVVYLLWGRRRQEGVPFLNLWLGPVEGPRPKRRVAAPPIPLALAILAMLLAVLGAARPVVRAGAGGLAMTVIVDRGASMSALGAGEARYVESAVLLQQELARLGATARVELVEVPGGAAGRGIAGEWPGNVRRIERTAADTGAAVRAEVERRLAEGGTGPVVVLSDQPLPQDARVVRVAPESAVRNAGIVSLAAREAPRPQVMVRVRNGTGRADAELRVTAGGQDVSMRMELPQGGATRDYFVDVAQLGDVVRAELRPGDAFGGDDGAWLVREGRPPRVEVRGAVPAELRRMVEVYTASRAPGADASRVAVVPELGALSQDATGVVLAAGGDAGGSGTTAPLEVRLHPITRGIDWEFLRPPLWFAEAPPVGWVTLLTVGGRPAVAVRETPARQVWVGVESDDWPRRAEYVVFWANVFDWVGGGETRFASYPVQRLEGSWRPVEQLGTRGSPPVSSTAGLWPGLYERVEDGTRRAVNAGDVHYSDPPPMSWRARLAELTSGNTNPAVPLWRWVLLAAAGCLGLAAMSWKGRNLTAFSARRTVPG